jgi:hypothetical protein
MKIALGSPAGLKAEPAVLRRLSCCAWLFAGAAVLLWACAGPDVPLGCDEAGAVVCACDELVDGAGAVVEEEFKGVGLDDVSVRCFLDYGRRRGRRLSLRCRSSRG